MKTYSDFELRIFCAVKDHGWHCNAVFDPESQIPGFVYSVGFSETLKSAEFIVFGLPSDLMHQMLWAMFRKVEQGLKIKEDLKISGLLEGFDCVLRRARHKELHSEYTRSAYWFWQETGHRGAPEVYQIVWPGSKGGLFPWDKGCAAEVIEAQPQLWHLN